MGTGGKGAGEGSELCGASVQSCSSPQKEVPCPQIKGRQALPKASLMISRKSPTFILLKLEILPSSGKQQENSSLQVWIQSCQGKNLSENCLKIVLWLF